jgi:hypothetical protein
VRRVLQAGCIVAAAHLAGVLCVAIAHVHVNVGAAVF